MRVTVTAKGPTLDTLTRDTIRDLRAANRTAGRTVAKVGKRAMETGAPTMFGRRLRVTGDVDAWPDRVAVEFHPASGQSGAWSIQESGRRGGYLVEPRQARALQLPGGFAATARPGPVAGRLAWSRAGQRLAAVLDRELVDVYDNALDA